jgi:hypothetical protein
VGDRCQRSRDLANTEDRKVRPQVSGTPSCKGVRSRVSAREKSAIDWPSGLGNLRV